MLGNGHCDSACLNPTCGNDGGDCIAQACSAGCYPYMLNDGKCEAECVNELCGWDSPDCECAPGCSVGLLRNSDCDAPCDNAACGFDGGVCVCVTQGNCASGCFSAMKGDGTCQEACYSAACEWDLRDCGCSPGCRSSDYGHCKPECLIITCMYDQIPGFPQCADALAVLAAQYYHITTNDYFSPFSYAQSCAVPVPDCTSGEWTLAQSACSSACNVPQCAMSLGHCLASPPCSVPPLCTTCALGGTGCLQCQPGSFRLYLYCVAGCPTDYAAAGDFCVPGTDLTTADSPVDYYVSPSATEDGVGSREKPFSSFDIALTICAFKHCRIHLYPGTHVLRPSPSSAHITSLRQPMLSHPGINHNITVVGLDCAAGESCASPPATLLFDNLNPVRITVFGALALENVELSGRSTLVAGCNTEKCMYCGAYTQSGTTYTDDQGKPLALGTFATSDLCTSFRYFSFFVLSNTSTLSLRNCTVSNFRQGLQSLFTMVSGQLTFQSVQFVNISTSAVPDMSFYASYSIRAAMIQQNSTNSVGISELGTRVEPGAIVLDNVTVSLLNNGYELSASLIQYGILVVNGIRSISITNSRFSRCIVQSGPLISAFVFISFSIDNCTFDRVFTEYSLIKAAGTGLMSPGPNGELDDFLINHFSVTRCNFTAVSVVPRNSAVPSSLFYYLNMGLGMNFLFQDIRIDESIGRYSLMYISRSSNSGTDKDKFGYTIRIVLPNGQRKTLSVPKLSSKISRVTALRTYTGTSHFILSTLSNLQLSEVNLLASGDGDVKVNNLTLSKVIGTPDVYLTKPLVGEASTLCGAPVNVMNCYAVSFTDCVFSRLRCTKASTGIGGVQATVTGDFVISNVRFRGSTGVSSSAAAVLSLSVTGAATITSLTVENCTDKGTSGMGLVHLAATLGATVSSAQFIGNDAQGAALHATNCGSLAVFSSLFRDNRSKTQAGVYFNPATGFAQTQLNVSDSTFINNQGIDGTAIFLTNTALSPVIVYLGVKNCVFTSNVATGVGSAVYVDNKTPLDSASVLYRCQFLQNSAREGVVMLVFLSGALRIDQCAFTENIGVSTCAISASPQPSTSLSPTWIEVRGSNFTANVGTSAIKLGNPNGVEVLLLTRNRFERNEMRLIDLERTNVTDSDSIYVGNSGSAFRLTTSSQGNVQNSQFFSGLESIGGALYLGGTSVMQCTNCTFDNNTAATNGGAVYIEQASVFSCVTCTFQRNKAGVRGSAVYLFGSPANSSFRNTLFRDNRSGDSATVAAISGSVRFLNSSFQRNSAGKFAGITAYFSNVSLTNSSFSEHSGLASALIYSALESNLVMRGCRVEGLQTSSNGGVIYALSSLLSITDSVFSGIQATSGAVLLAEAGSQFSFSGTQISDITSKHGVIIASAGSGAVTNSVFKRFRAGGIVATGLSALQLVNVSFVGKRYSDGSGDIGTAVYCSECEIATFRSCAFEGLNATEGAGVYIVSSIARPAPWGRAIFDDCDFRNLKGVTYGAVVLESVNGEFTHSRFSSCSALGSPDQSRGEGGALSLFCAQIQSGCDVTIDSCEFADNWALLEGGSIHWHHSKPTVTNSTFQRGYAQYGPDFASYPVAITLKVVMGNGTATGPLEGLLRGVASGQIAKQTIQAALLDHYQQVVSTETESTATVIANVSSTSIIGTTSFAVENGTYMLHDFGITAPPETSTTIYIKTNAIDFSKSAKAKDNTTYHNALRIQVEMRPCDVGESRAGSQCMLCPAGKYSLDPEQSCQDCPQGAICYGNFTMVPKSGYWRSGLYTDVFWECPYAASCTGSPEPPETLSLTGECATGYFGNMCNGCKPGFSRLNSIECGRCPERAVNAIRTSGIAIAVLLFLVLVVWTSIRSAHRARSYFSIYIKILLNYLQLVMITANFNLSWPTYVVQLFKVQQAAGNITDQVFSVDCFLGNSREDDQANAVRTKIVMLVFLPLLLFLISLVFWLPVAVVRKKWSLLKNELVTTAVVFFFLVHPSLMKFMFDFVNCKQIDAGQYWMSSYLNIRCWDSAHFRYSLTVALPAIIIWGVGLPAICLLYLIKHSSQLSLVHMRLRLGFLYNGYDTVHFYWEFVILYRKLLIVSIAVFLSAVSVYVQALTVMGVIIAALGMQSRHKPFIVPQMNALELRAVLVGGVTIYCGMYSLTQGMDYTSKMILFLVIVLINVYFLSYWMVYVVTASWSILRRRLVWLGSLCGRPYRIKPSNPTRLSSIDGLKGSEAIQSSAVEGTFIDVEDSRIHSRIHVPDNSRIECEPGSRRDASSP